jgi:tetratricopeptide (TPR) repeat protein
VPIDREAALRTAERLLRQGKLDGAIEQYVRLVEEQPRDWNSINALGDLYVRAGDVDRAVAQFVRIADYLFGEGFLPKAAALYKKALKVKNDHEHTLLRLADIAARQELLADAKLYLRQLAQQRQNRGDDKGVAECVMRMASLDETDGDAKVAAARAAQAIGDVQSAVGLYREAAAVYDKQGRDADARSVLIAATDLAPEDADLRAMVAKALVSAGDLERAQHFLDPATAGDDADLLLMSARAAILAGRAAEGQVTLMRCVALAPSRRQPVEALVTELLDIGRPDDAYGCAEVLTDAALFEADFNRAVHTLESFLERRRTVAALLKLVDVYVDAGLDDRITAAQGQLADAYLDEGQPAEARVIAEDLLTREPEVQQHIDRLRRALVALGVDNPDEVVARQLDTIPIFGESLDFTMVDDVTEAPAREPVPESPATPDEGMGLIPSVADVEQPAPTVALSAPVIRDLQGLVGEDQDEIKESFEIDLSETLADLNMTATPGTAAAMRPAGTSDGGDRPTGAAYDHLRARNEREESAAEATTLFERAQEHLRRGLAAEATAALQAAARVPQLRFKAAAQLGRLSLSRGDFQDGVEWLERAAAAPAPSADETFGVLYDLADTLARIGEPVRALAVFMELEADAGTYRDVRARIEQLTTRSADVTPRLSEEHS